MNSTERHKSVREKCLKEIEGIKGIGNEDRLVLQEMIAYYEVDLVRRLSFVSSDTSVEEYPRLPVEFGSDGPFRVLSGLHWGSSLNGMVIDHAGRYIATSSHIFHHPYLLVKVLPDLLDASHKVFDLPTTRIGLSSLSVERWPPSFGHLVDEIFTAAYAVSNVPALAKYVPLVDYPTKGQSNADQSWRNVGRFAHAIFGGSALNLSGFQEPSIEVSQVALMGNRVIGEAFHRFPNEIVQRFLNYSAPTTSQRLDRDKGAPVFLTRDASRDPLRVIQEMDAMTDEARIRGYQVLSPERESVESLAIAISGAPGLVCSWGGAFINAMFAPPGTRVVLIKPPAYKSENLEYIFHNLISEHHLEIKVLDEELSVDPVDDLRNLFDWLEETSPGRGDSCE